MKQNSRHIWNQTVTLCLAAALGIALLLVLHWFSTQSAALCPVRSLRSGCSAKPVEGSGSEQAISSPLSAGEFASESSGSTNLSDNLLSNGDMDQLGFYWRPTNHFVANMWYEWFWTGNIPEFIDGGIPYHDVCYPRPASGICADNENSSQGHIRWGDPFVAGIYQPVSSVAPCTYYEFTAYNRNDSDTYHPKLGIDPTGYVLPPYDEYPSDLPVNCPPDGHSECPDPGLDDLSDLPSTIVWSPEFDHAAFTWAGQSMVAEALSTTITVWTYVAPEQSGSLSAYWDYASLVQLSPQDSLLVSPGTLPAPDGGISNVVSTTLFNAATINWRTDDPAYSQILYHYVGPASDTSPPPIADSTDQFEYQTDINWTSHTWHSLKLQGLESESLYDVALLSRRWTGAACQTSVHLTRIETTDLIVPTGVLPAPDDHITELHVIPQQQSAYVWWRSDVAARSQVLYHRVLTQTAPYPTQTHKVYLPVLHPVARPAASYFELRTTPNTETDTVHWYYLPNLESEAEYTFAAVIAWTEGDVDYYAALSVVRFETGVYAQATDGMWSDIPPEVRAALGQGLGD